MKILFYATNQDISLGSYRIWGNDLNQYMQEIGHSSKLYTGSPKEVEEADVIIFAKNDWKDSIKVKEYYPEKIIGTTNLSADISSKVNCDFVIVGSLEEKCSLSKYQNVFLYPLIEKMFQSEDLYKIHEPKDRLTIGFHGSYTHLAKFYPYLYKAIERLDKEQDITLKVITSSGFIWNSAPNIKNIDIIPWDYKTMAEEIISCDIGVVPNITPISLRDISSTRTSVDQGLYESDFISRYKNKSNAGRAFVFHQLGVPVIADLTPSNFHILGDERNGYIAHDDESWVKALRKLSDHKTRQETADNAKKEFDRLYDPHEWAKILYNNIEGLKNDI